MGKKMCKIKPKYKDVIVPIPLVSIKSRYEDTPVLRSSYTGSIISCVIARVYNNKKSITEVKRAGQKTVVGVRGLRSWYSDMKKKYIIFA